MTRPSVTAGLPLLASLLFAAACAHRRAPPPQQSLAAAAPAPADLPPPDAIPGSFTVRQKLTARSQHGGGSFEVVMQKRPGSLSLLGLTPYGSRAFLLQQLGAEVKLTSYIPRELPFPPTFILMDVHRVLDAPAGAAPPADGERTVDRGADRIHERWQGGRLARRQVVPAAAGAQPRGEVTIDYQGQGPSGLPAHVTLRNSQFGYELSIETVAAQ